MFLLSLFHLPYGCYLVYHLWWTHLVIKSIQQHLLPAKGLCWMSRKSVYHFWTLTSWRSGHFSLLFVFTYTVVVLIYELSSGISMHFLQWVIQLHCLQFIQTAFFFVILGKCCTSSQSPLTQLLDLIGGSESGFWFRLVDLFGMTDAISLPLSLKGGVCQTF